jgi:hypothetical protein
MGVELDRAPRPLTTRRPERQLVLISAATAGRRHAARAHAEQLARHVDWEALARTLRERRLLPTLGPRILELCPGRASAGFAAAVERAIETGRRQGAFLALICARVTATLSSAGIRAAPLKGPVLAEAIYGDLGRRSCSDIDVLVAAEELRAAVGVVRALGYKPPVDHVGRGGLPLLHFALAHERGELPPVELHWRIHWYERRFARERLLPPQVARDADRWRPAAVDELAALLLFYARDGFVDLRLASDLSAWWDAFHGELAPGAFAGLVREHPALARALVAALRAAERVVGLPRGQILASEPRRGARGRIAVRMANPNPGCNQAQRHADTALVDALLMPPSDFGAYLKRQLLLPAPVLADRAKVHGQRRSGSPLGHAARVLGRHALAVVRLARVPEAVWPA